MQKVTIEFETWDGLPAVCALLIRAAKLCRVTKVTWESGTRSEVFIPKTKDPAHEFAQANHEKFRAKEA